MIVTEGAQTSTDAGASGGAQAGSSTQAATTGERTLTQEQFNAALAEEKRTWKRQQDEAAAKLKREADEAAAAQRGEWERLANERAAERDRVSSERDAAAAELDALRAEIEAEIKPRLKALPEELRDLVPADGTPAQRLAAVRKLEAAASKLAGVAPGGRGTPSGPRGSQATATAPADDILASKRARIGGL